MKKVIRWQANDGSLHLHRASAVAADRAIKIRDRNSVWAFLITCWSIEWPKRHRIPAGAWRDSGVILYTYFPKADTPNKAIEMAVRRCLSLRNKTPGNWTLDEDMQVRRPNGKTESVYLGNNDVAKPAF